jgi:hypothetical protein
MSKVEKLDLKVEWSSQQGGMPKINVGKYDIYGSGEAGLYQAVDMIAKKLNELIEATSEELKEGR